MTKLGRDQIILQIVNKLGCVSRGVQAAHKFEFGGQILNRAQVDILLRLGSTDGILLKDLAAYLNVSAGAISQFVDELVDKKMVKRSEGKQDRRAVELRLSQMMGKQKQAFIEAYLVSVKEMFGNLTDQEVLSLQSLLGKLNYKPGSCELKGGECNE